MDKRDQYSSSTLMTRLDVMVNVKDCRRQTCLKVCNGMPDRLCHEKANSVLCHQRCYDTLLIIYISLNCNEFPPDPMTSPFKQTRNCHIKDEDWKRVYI